MRSVCILAIISAHKIILYYIINLRYALRFYDIGNQPYTAKFWFSDIYLAIRNEFSADSSIQAKHVISQSAKVIVVTTTEEQKTHIASIVHVYQVCKKT